MRMPMPLPRRSHFVAVAGVVTFATLLMPARDAFAQDADPGSRAAAIEEAQAEKAKALHPYTPGKVETYLDYAQAMLTAGGSVFHPYFDSAYSGGGFTLGGGYLTHVGAYSTLDVRGSITPSGYKRVESEFIAPRLFHRRGLLSLLGGWREATQVGYYGTGTNNSQDDRANYGFKEPYGIATLSLRPLPPKFFVTRLGVEGAQWQQTPGSGDEPSVETVYTPQTLPGLGETVTYVHSHAMVGIDTREAPGYARRGGFYGISFHDFNDMDNLHGFTQWQYEAVQHVPIWREAWVLSFHGRVNTTGTKDGEVIPFFMLPSVGGGSSLRGYSSWRFRDRNSLEIQAEWRVMVNRFFDMAIFDDAGKVTAHSRDLTPTDLKNDVGFGVRFHGPIATPLRVEVATGNEGFSLIFAASAAF